VPSVVTANDVAAARAEAWRHPRADYAPRTTLGTSPLAGVVDLTGKVGRDFVDATYISPGSTITSAVYAFSVFGDRTNTVDYYAVALEEGKTYRFVFSSSNRYGNAPLSARLQNPWHEHVAGMDVHRSLVSGVPPGDCANLDGAVYEHFDVISIFRNSDCSYKPNLGGIYVLLVQALPAPVLATAGPQAYTFTIQN
jgi:hypothetical protein